MFIALILKPEEKLYNFSSLYFNLGLMFKNKKVKVNLKTNKKILTQYLQNVWKLLAGTKHCIVMVTQVTLQENIIIIIYIVFPIIKLDILVNSLEQAVKARISWLTKVLVWVSPWQRFLTNPAEIVATLCTCHFITPINLLKKKTLIMLIVEMGKEGNVLFNDTLTMEPHLAPLLKKN